MPNRGRPEKILADLMTDPKAYRLQKASGMKFRTPVPHQIRQFEKIVLDEQATRMAVRIAAAKPIDLLHMLDVALPPSSKTWIEWPSVAMLSEQKAMQGEGLSVPATNFDWNIESRPSWARCGVLIETLEEGYQITCIEHADEQNLIYEWPVSFLIVKDSQTKLDRPTDGLSDDNSVLVMRGKAKSIEQASVVWGYGMGTKGLNNLSRRGRINVSQHMTIVFSTLSEGDPRLFHKLIMETTHELSGIVRITVAMLAMLHTSMIIDDAVRPSGRFISKGKSHPFTERRIARLSVPGRVRNLENYVRQNIKDEGDRIRKRYHKVKAHFRHSHFLPINGEGWVKCMCPGRKPGTWHKKIDEHWRGDESLGTVHHPYTLVTGSTSTN